jgi:hypothetical protein
MQALHYFSAISRYRPAINLRPFSCNTGVRLKIATSSTFLLRPFTISTLVDDSASVAEANIAPNLFLGRALLKSASSGAAVVVAANPETKTNGKEAIDYKKLAKGVGAIAAETLTGKVIAQSAWELSALSSTTTPDELAKTLIAQHVAPAKAQTIAENALKLLHDPISRGILISISAGAATYIVVQRTSLSRNRKWAIILGAALLAGAVFAALYKLNIAA